MNTFKSYSYSSGKSFTEKFLGSLVFLLFIVLLFYIFFQVYKFLWFASPVFLLIALILEPKVVFAYFRNIWHQLKENFLQGLMNLLINIIGFPFVSIGLIFKAWIFKKFGRLNDQIKQDYFEEKFTSYEEMESDNKPRKSNTSNTLSDGRYDDLFE